MSVDVVQDSFLQNWVSVGVPGILAPEEVSEETLAVVLPPVGDRQRLTFRVEPDSDFYVDQISVILWEVGGQPGARTLSWVTTQGVYAPVFIEFFDSAARRDEQTGAMLWNNLAGAAGTPQWTLIPKYLAAGNSYGVNVINRSPDTTYAINIQLHGRKKRVERSRDGNTVPPIPEWMAANVIRDRQLGYPGASQPLTANNAENVRRVGVTRAQTLKDLEGRPLTAPIGNLDAPARFPGEIFHTDSQYDFFARYSKAFALGQAPQVGDDDFRSIAFRWPIFIQLRDERMDYVWSQQPVPIACCFGMAGLPHVLPVDWVWERSGIIACDLWSLTDQEPDFWIMFEGWMRSGSTTQRP